MTISSISGGSVPSFSSGASSSVDQLEKQKTDLQKKISDETNSKDDDKIKAMKIAQYQQQIQQIDAQIQAAKAKKSAHGDHSQNQDQGKTISDLAQALKSSKRVDKTV